MAALDHRLADELKWKDKLRSDYSERFTRHGKPMGNCVNCGREGIAGYVLLMSVSIHIISQRQHLDCQIQSWQSARLAKRVWNELITQSL